MALDPVQFPTLLPSSRIRRELMVAAGRLLRRVAPEQAAKAARGELPNRLALWHRLLLAPALAESDASGDFAALEPLHRWLWSSGQAVAFHDSARERFARWWPGRHDQLVAPLRETFGGRIHTLCEIGTGNGLVLNDLAARLPELERLVGLDLNAAQMRLNAQRNTDPRVSFVAADAGEHLTRKAEPGWAVLTNAGVFEYFPPARLSAIFEVMAKRAPSTIALIEPLAEAFDPDVSGPSVPYNAERSFSHPYLAMLKRAGLRIAWKAEQRLDGIRWLLAVAVS